MTQYVIWGRTSERDTQGTDCYDMIRRACRIPVPQEDRPPKKDKPITPLHKE